MSQSTKPELWRCRFSACFRTEVHSHFDEGEDISVETTIENGQITDVQHIPPTLVELENVRFIHSTVDGERIMAYCARVSSSNQDNPDLALLKYCITHGHWSVFEMASLCVEITTSRALSPQILRHRSFSFQEFSQRYARPTEMVLYDARRQDVKNRQASIDDLTPESKDWFLKAQKNFWNVSQHLYDEAVKRGIAKECARMLLPMNVQTQLYMHGTVRSWIHYLQLRTTPGTQKEHRDIALQIQLVFAEQFPVTAAALGWNAAHT